ncbi:unnamed protein product [Lymnaea stagnalis]|uniref:Fibronectin type-III domain-containing protein n=1 Tax=Lymnaea stagnalis TaxID=6523 RepID=A0AAV2HI51_LYMST
MEQLLQRKNLQAFFTIILCCCVGKSYLLTTDGAVSPADPFKFVGETLELYCNITNPNADIRENSSLLYFERSTINETRFKSLDPFYDDDLPIKSKIQNDFRLIPSDFIEILTTKAIRLRLSNLEIGDSGRYVCNKRTYTGGVQFIGNQIVKVDYKPVKIRNISCRVYNWESMTCSWDLGVKFAHPENVNVSLVYTFDGRQHDCPNLTLTTCEWSSKHYNHGHMYVMKLEVKTKVNNKELAHQESDTFRVETVLYVEPAPVLNFKAAVLNSTCVNLTWGHSARHREKLFNVGFRKKSWGDWLQLPLIEDISAKLQTTVCNLTPFTSYEFRISVLPKPVDSPVDQGYISSFKYTEATTEEDVPAAAPALCPGCYIELKCKHNKTNRCIRLYWKDLNETYKNGKITQYHIQVCTRDMTINKFRTVHIKPPKNLTSEDVEIPDSDLPIKIVITPGTVKGLSQNSSYLIVPPKVKKPKAPENFLVERDENDELHFYLSWAALEVNYKPRQKYTSITISWCKRQHLVCQGDIQWLNLTADSVTHELKSVSRDISIGISAEVTIDEQVISSGIQWSDCIYKRNQKPLQSPKKVRVSSAESNLRNGLSILWDKFTCADEESYITEYLVKYCPTNDKICYEPEKSENVSNHHNEVTLKNLKGDTKYLLYVIAVSAAGLGPRSPELYGYVKGIPPEANTEKSIAIIIGIVLFIFIAIAVFLCWRYCRARKKRIMEDYIEPYAQTQKNSSKNTQDYRNRPLPKTPSEEQHFYGSSACMSNLGSEKVKDNRHSETSDDSITSQTNLIPSPIFVNKNIPPKGSNKYHPKDVKSINEPTNLLRENHSSNIDSAEKEKQQVRLGTEPKYQNIYSKQESRPDLKIYKNFNGSVNKAEESVEDYLKFSIDEPDALKKTEVNKDPQTNIYDTSIINFSQTGTLPLREISVYHVQDTTQSINPLSSSIFSGQSSSAEIFNSKSKVKVKPKNPAYVRRFKPELNPSLAIQASSASTNLAIPDSSESTNARCTSDYVPNAPLVEHAKMLNTPTVLSGYVALPFVTELTKAEKQHLQHENSSQSYPTQSNLQKLKPRTVEPFYIDNRRSMPLETVLHFPPPPLSPPPTLLPPHPKVFSDSENIQIASQYNEHSQSQYPIVNNGYAPQCVLSQFSSTSLPYHPETESANFELQHNSPTLAASTDYLPHHFINHASGSESALAQGKNQYDYSPVASTMPRPHGPAKKTLLLPLQLSRPLSGDLLDLPPEYYLDPHLDGSNQILTEL